MGMIDFHVHYNEDYPLIDKACIFPFTDEIYEGDNPYFEDTAIWQKKRQENNEKNLGIENTTAFLFLWTDFNISNIEKYGGIKLHRHWNEPMYDWESKKGKIALEAIRDLNLPVILDDVPDRIVRFIKEHALGINIVIPHLTNYPRIKRARVFHLDNVYVDTSLTWVDYIMDYVKSFGADRMIFGSDWPFGSVKDQIRRIQILPISSAKKDKILNENALKVVKL